MKKTAFFALILAVSILPGCRREDIREFTVEIPGLTAANKEKVVRAFFIENPSNPRLNRYRDGIDVGSFRFDFAKKTLTMKYDSMKIAHTNIRMLIQDQGIEVTFPSNTTGRAGY